MPSNLPPGYQISPTRRLSVPSRASSGLSQSTRQCERLIFPDIYDTWYKGRENLKIDEIQHRKEFNRPFFHEFILIRFDDGSSYRFDRRPNPTQPMKTLREVGSEAYDTVESVVDIDKAPHAPSECIVSLDFKDRRVGLPLILAVCSAISSDTEARRYTIREFNCYFFSWTIIATVARYCVAWESVPYAANSLCLPRGKLSETIAQGVIKELTGSLPNALSVALAAALPEMLIVNIPHSVPELPAYVNLFRGDFPPQLRLKLSSDSFRTELSRILQWKNQVIAEALSNSLNYERLREAIESLALQGHRHGHLDRASLSILLQRLLWQGDVVPTLSSNMDKWAGQWNTPEGTEEMMGGEGLWAVTSRTLVEFVANDIQMSVSSQIAQRVSSIVVDILGSEAGSTATRGQITPATIISSVQRVVDHAISEITEFSVKNLVGRMREHMEVTRGAIQDTIIHNVKDLFPSELPIGLRIPKAQNSRLRQLLWLARPESAFCLWRTPRELQTCDLVKHQELQNYLYRRIKAHSRDARVLGGGPREVEASIRKAMSRIWLAGSMILAGLNNRPGVNAFENGGISISFYEGTK